MITIETLNEYGADVEDGIARCMGNEEFYIKMVNVMLSDNSPEKLKAAIDAKDLDTAFETAHSLKGVAGNLSLTPLSEPAVEITELLRARTEMDYQELLDVITEQWKKLEALAES